MNDEIIILFVAAFFGITIVFIKNMVENYIDAIRFNKQLQIMHERHMAERKEMLTKIILIATPLILSIIKELKSKDDNRY